MSGVDRVAAPLFFAEVTSVLRNRVYSGTITPNESDQAFAYILSLDFRELSPSNLHQQAWALAKQYNLLRTYDAQYLALATILGAEWWAAGQRLVNTIGQPWLKLVS